LIRGLAVLNWEDGLKALVAEGIEAIVFRTVGDQCSLWESMLPEQLRRLPEELARVDELLDDPAFFAPFVVFFDPRIGRPSTPMETYLRLMFLKFRYRLGYESLCREVSDSITWRMFCRIGLDGSVPHPTTLMKLTTRCGPAAVDGLNEALLAKAAEAKLLRTNRIRADTTVVSANVCYPTDSGLLAKAVRRIAATGTRIQAAGGATRTALRDRSRAAVSGRTRSRPNCVPGLPWVVTRPPPRCSKARVSWPIWLRPRPMRLSGCWSMPRGRSVAPAPGLRHWPLAVSMMRLRAAAAAGWCARSTICRSCWP
jgi:IS5 family transposase